MLLRVRLYTLHVVLHIIKTSSLHDIFALDERDSRDYPGQNKGIHAIFLDYFKLRLCISSTISQTTTLTSDFETKHEHKHDKFYAVIIISSNVDVPVPGCPRKTQTVIYCT